jgi:hypothetical protein
VEHFEIPSCGKITRNALAASAVQIPTVVPHPPDLSSSRLLPISSILPPHPPPHRARDHSYHRLGCGCGGRRRRRASSAGRAGAARRGRMSGHDSKYFSTTKKGEIPELKEELNSQYKVRRLTTSFSFHHPPARGLVCARGSRSWRSTLGRHARPFLDLRV